MNHEKEVRTDYDDQRAGQPRRSLFISYSHDDRAIVYLMVSLLKAAEVNILWDQAIRAGQKWEDVLLDWLIEADLAFVFWSSRAAKSEWVATEYQLIASQAGKSLIPVLLDDAPLPPGLRERQAIDMGTVLNQWVKRDNGDIHYAQVHAAALSQALLHFLSGGGDQGILNTLDTFDLHYALSEVGRALDLGRYLAWRGTGVPTPLKNIYTE